MNVGFVSTRFAGTDGVSLESAKWAEIFGTQGDINYWFAGELDRDPDASMLEPLAHFNHEEVQWIQRRIFHTRRRQRPREVTEKIHEIRMRLKNSIYSFISRFHIDLLIAENALTIPMHVPLGLALSEVIAETRIPCIAHHHDFHWERTRFLVNCIPDYLAAAFPPRFDYIQHVVINRAARDELSYRTGLSSTVVPNVLDFEHPPSLEFDDFNVDLRERIGLSPDDIFILQPTRVVPRKGIEHSIELVRRLGNPRCKLVISHAAGDEGLEYLHYLKDYARYCGVDIRIISPIIGHRRGVAEDGTKIYTLWDVFPHADFVTYPSIYEGFGNAFLEAIYFKRPILVNRYPIFQSDIEPLGFDVVMMEQFITTEVVEKVREVLENPERRRVMVEHNYEVARENFSYAVLREKLNSLIKDMPMVNKI